MDWAGGQLADSHFDRGRSYNDGSYDNLSHLGGLRRSQSQPRLSTGMRSGFHLSSSTSNLSDLRLEVADMSSDLRLEASKKMRESRTKSPPPRRQLASSPRNHSKWKQSNGSSKVRKGGFDLDGDQDSSATTESDGEMEMRGRSRQPKPQNAGNSSQSETTDNEERTASPAPAPMRTTPLTPDLKERAEDDIAVRPQPSRHVDYLSHNWREEELWMSWKFIVSRRGDYANAARLENASWRTWWKNKNNLKTVNPLELNW